MTERKRWAFEREPWRYREASGGRHVANAGATPPAAPKAKRAGRWLFERDPHRARHEAQERRRAAAAKQAAAIAAAVAWLMDLDAELRTIRRNAAKVERVRDGARRLKADPAPSISVGPRQPWNLEQLPLI